MAKNEDLRLIMDLSKSKDKVKAENYYTNLNMNCSNAREGLFKIKQIMEKYKIPFDAAYQCILDPKQMAVLKTMKPKDVA